MVEVFTFPTDQDLIDFTNGTLIGSARTYNQFLMLMRAKASHTYTGFKINGVIGDRNDVERHFGVAEDGMF